MRNNHKVGENNLQKFGMDFHHPVFFVSALVVFTFVVASILFPTTVKEVLDGVKLWSINYFDWLFVSAANIFVIFCLLLIILPVGKIRLGGIDAKKEFSTLSWLSMLFAAGMGIGLMYWSVAEPVAHYTGWYYTPLGVEPNTSEAKDLAMGATMFHWGFHPWAIYAVVGLSLAFFSFNKKLPLTIRSAFFPILGNKIWGWQGHVIDILAVFATIFGLATSLGFGVQQITAGLHFLFDIGNTTNNQIIIIAAITALALISVVRGLDRGVKILSNFTIIVAFLLVAFIIITGSTTDILLGIGTTLNDYFSNILALSNPVNREDSGWYHGWTVFYWAWWIAWSPFVGMFIARISKGRTVREFLIAVLFVPVSVTAVWMSTFGLSALQQVIDKVGVLANGLDDKSLAMFQMLEHLPFASITSVVAIFLVIVFFVTSSDSGSLVIDSITAGGKLDAPVPQRVFWAIAEGFVAAALLYAGGNEALSALQAGSISTALPFVFILLIMCYSLYKGLSADIKDVKNIKSVENLN